MCLQDVVVTLQDVGGMGGPNRGPEKGCIRAIICYWEDQSACMGGGDGGYMVQGRIGSHWGMCECISVNACTNECRMLTPSGAELQTAVELGGRYRRRMISMVSGALGSSTRTCDFGGEAEVQGKPGRPAALACLHG